MFSTKGALAGVTKEAFPSLRNAMSAYSTAASTATRGTKFFNGALAATKTLIMAHPILTAVAAIGITIGVISKVRKEQKELREELIQTGKDAKKSADDLDSLIK